MFDELVKATYNNGNPLPEFNNAAQVNTHLTPRPILLTRHGESKDNVRGRIGEDNPLSFISVYYTIWFCLIIRPVPLKEEVTTLRRQLAVHGEEMKAYVGHVRDLVRAIQMFGLQILLLVPDLATPSTFEPFHHIDTQ
nr:6-phosphofructo-2-kinase/fructose-2,6-bisphosphatase-like [Malus domestica]